MNVHSIGKQQDNLLTDANLVKKKFSRQIGKNAEPHAAVRSFATKKIFADWHKKNARENEHFSAAKDGKAKGKELYPFDYPQSDSNGNLPDVTMVRQFLLSGFLVEKHADQIFQFTF